MLALVALVRQREAQARAQALEFELARQTLEREAADARLQFMARRNCRADAAVRYRPPLSNAA